MKVKNVRIVKRYDLVRESRDCMKKKLTLLVMLVFTFSCGLMLSESRNVEAASTTEEITYQASVQKSGWQNFVKNGQTAGTTGKSLRLEAIKMKLANAKGSVEYSTYVEKSGWQNFVKDGAVAGKPGKSLRLEALKIRLTGNVATKYDVYYRGYVEKKGWLPWQKNGEVSGTMGQNLRLEAVEVKLVAKIPPKTSGEKVVDLARKQIGIPYLWGGTTRAGFDCSGLTQYVYKQALGKNIGRVTTNQEKSGSIIALKDAKPGDLVFWGTKGSTYHVGIYIGNGNYIHSPQPGQNVKIQSFTWYKPHFAVRVK